jgi:hypothetical protein
MSLPDAVLSLVSRTGKIPRDLKEKIDQRFMNIANVISFSRGSKFVALCFFNKKFFHASNYIKKLLLLTDGVVECYCIIEKVLLIAKFKESTKEKKYVKFFKERMFYLFKRNFWTDLEFVFWIVKIYEGFSSPLKGQPIETHLCNDACSQFLLLFVEGSSIKALFILIVQYNKL